MTAKSIETAFLSVSFQGLSTGGSISVPGVKTGDVLMQVYTSGNPPSVAFVTEIASDDTVVQYDNSNWSSYTFTAIVSRFTPAV